jgi:hypothetical protein
MITWLISTMIQKINLWITEDHILVQI